MATGWNTGGTMPTSGGTHAEDPARLLHSIASHDATRAIRPRSQLQLELAARALQAEGGGYLVIALPPKDGQPVEMTYLGFGAERMAQFFG